MQIINKDQMIEIFKDIEGYKGLCDRKYNINYGTAIQRISKQVLCLETGKIYPSANEVQRQLGFAQGNISACCNGRIKQAYGFHWKYVE